MNRLKRLRKEKNETQYTLAELLSVNEKTISRWENGESNIKPDKAQQLADFFGVSVGYLLGYERKTGDFNIEDLKKARDVLDWVIKEFENDKNLHKK